MDAGHAGNHKLYTSSHDPDNANFWDAGLEGSSVTADVPYAPRAERALGIVVVIPTGNSLCTAVNMALAARHQPGLQ